MPQVIIQFAFILSIFYVIFSFLIFIEQSPVVPFIDWVKGFIVFIIFWSFVLVSRITKHGDYTSEFKQVESSHNVDIVVFDSKILNCNSFFKRDFDDGDLIECRTYDETNLGIHWYHKEYLTVK